MRINGVPLRNAIRVPATAPATFAAAIGIPIASITCPLGKKNDNAARLVARLTTFAAAEARRKSSPKKRMNRKIRKLPVPGPKNPS